MPACTATSRTGVSPSDGAGGRINIGRRDPLQVIYERPGFKLRRSHQIASSVFAQECRAFDVTTTQYGVLQLLSHYGGRVDQIGVAQLLGIDRSTAGIVVEKLARRSLVRRDPDPTDRRRLLLSLTPEGQRFLAAILPAAERARLRLMEPFSAVEAEQFLTLLNRLLDHHNGMVRVPLVISAPRTKPASPSKDAAGTAMR